MSRRAVYRVLIGYVAAAAVMAWGASAAPAAPVLLSTTGSGQSVGAAVDATGNLHVVWADKSPSGELEYRYCRIPAGASACAGTDSSQPGDSQSWSFHDAYSDGERGYAFFAPPSTVVLAISLDGTSDIGEYTITSTDDGVTFGAPVRATSVFEGDTNDAYSNGSVVLGIGGAANLLGVYDGYQFNAFDSMSSTYSLSLIPGTIGGTQAMALDTDGRPLAIAPSAPNVLDWTKYTGRDFAVASLTNQSNWSTPAAVPIPAPEGPPGAPSLSAGPRGLFLALQGNEHIFRFDAATGSWGTPTLSPVSTHRLAQDAAGRLYGYGNDYGGSASTLECYSHTDPSGANPTLPATLPVAMNPTFSRFALAPGGSDSAGWLVGGTTDGKVEAVPLSDATPNSACTSAGATAGAAHVYLRGSFRVNPNGTLSFTFVCPAGATGCTGTVTITVTGAGHLARSAANPSARIVQAVIHVAAGRTANVRVRLNRIGRKLLAHHHTIDATIVVASRVGSGPTTRTTRVAALKQAGR
jgi:hypothetical protein